MNRRHSIFADNREGVRYVKVFAIMSPLVAITDGLTLTYFGKSTAAYITIERAIGWCKNEMQFHSAEKYKTMIAALEKAQAESRERV